MGETFDEDDHLSKRRFEHDEDGQDSEMNVVTLSRGCDSNGKPDGERSSELQPDRQKEPEPAQ